MPRDSVGCSGLGVVVKPYHKASSRESQDNDSLTETPSSEPDSDYHSSRDIDADECELTLVDLRPLFRTSKSGSVQKNASTFVSEGHSSKQQDQPTRNSSGRGNGRNLRDETPPRDARSYMDDMHRSFPSSTKESRRESQRSRQQELQERRGNSGSHRSQRALSPASSKEESDPHHRKQINDRSRSEKSPPRKAEPNDHRRESSTRDSEGSSLPNAHKSHISSAHHEQDRHRSHSPHAHGMSREDNRRSSFSYIARDPENYSRYRSESPSPRAIDGSRDDHNHHRSTNLRAVPYKRNNMDQGPSEERLTRSSLSGRLFDVDTTKGESNWINEHVHRSGSRLPPERKAPVLARQGEAAHGTSKSNSRGSRQVRSQSPPKANYDDGRRQRVTHRSDNDELNAEMHESVGSLSISDLENLQSPPSCSRSVSNLLDDVLERSKGADLRRAFSTGDLGCVPCHVKSILRTGRYSPHPGGQEHYDSSGNSVRFSEAALIIPENDPGCTIIVKKDRFKSSSAAPKPLSPNELLAAVNAGADRESSRDMLKRLLRSRDCLDEPAEGDEPAFEDIWNDDDGSLPSPKQRQAARAAQSRVEANHQLCHETTDSRVGVERSNRSSPQSIRTAPMRAPTPPRQTQMPTQSAVSSRMQETRSNGVGRPPTNQVAPPRRVGAAGVPPAKQSNVAANTIHQIAHLGGSLRNIFGHHAQSNSHPNQAQPVRPDERSEIAAFAHQMGSATPGTANHAPRPGLPRGPNARSNGISQQPANGRALGGSLRNIFSGSSKQVGNSNQNVSPSAAEAIRMAADTRTAPALSARNAMSSSASINSIRSRGPQVQMSSSGSVCSATSRMSRPGLFKSQSARLTFMSVVRPPPPSQPVLGFWDPGSEEMQAQQAEPPALRDSRSQVSFGSGMMEMRPQQSFPAPPPSGGASVMSAASRMSRPGLFKSQSARLTFMNAVRPSPPSQPVLGFWDPGSEEMKEQQAEPPVLWDSRSQVSFESGMMEMRPQRSPPSRQTSGGASVMSAASRVSRPGLVKSQSVRMQQQHQQQQPPPPRNAFGHIDHGRVHTRPMMLPQPEQQPPPPKESSPRQDRRMSASEMRMHAAHSAFASNASAMAQQAQPYPPRTGYGPSATKDPRAVTAGRPSSPYMPPPVVNCVSPPNA